VEEKDEKTGSDPEIEAHARRGRSMRANEEPETNEAEESRDEGDDVEAHRYTRKSR
jgi:hypothetical protein